MAITKTLFSEFSSSCPSGQPPSSATCGPPRRRILSPVTKHSCSWCCSGQCQRSRRPAGPVQGTSVRITDRPGSPAFHDPDRAGDPSLAPTTVHRDPPDKAAPKYHARVLGLPSLALMRPRWGLWRASRGMVIPTEPLFLDVFGKSLLPHPTVPGLVACLLFTSPAELQ